MELNLKIGLTGENIMTVAEEHTVRAMGSGGVGVLSTPTMIGWMEGASARAVSASLPKGWITVGTRVDIEHLAPTSVGGVVTTTAQLVEIDRRRLVFEVESRNEQKQIGRGRHERFVVNTDRFENKDQSKKE